jgi:hypothetical protein
MGEGILVEKIHQCLNSTAQSEQSLCPRFLIALGTRAALMLGDLDEHSVGHFRIQQSMAAQQARPTRERAQGERDDNAADHSHTNALS